MSMRSARAFRALLLLACACAATAQEGEWRTLFDGRSLDGWTARGGRYDGDATWTVEEGAIVGREGPGGAGGLLYTEGEYESFELELEARISWPFDSGIFLRMVPPERGELGAQVTLDHRPGGEIGAIYCDGYFLHNPGGMERFERDGWNRLRVRCAGDPMHVSVWLGDELLTDYRIPEGSGRFAARGKIGLQVHGSEGAPPGSTACFRNLRLRELPAGAGRYFERDERGFLALTEAGEEAGWRALFNGRDLEGWEPGGSGYRVEDGLLCFLVEGDSPHLASARDYRDFHLRLDFRIAAMANSGLFLRAARDGSNPAFSGCEIQILDDFHWEERTGSRLEPYQKTGGLYGSLAPDHAALRPLGEWNTYDLLYRGPRLTVALNGRILYDVDTLELPVPAGTPPFAQRVPKGFLGLQRHAPGGEVEGEAYAWFRNLFVREL